MSVFLVWITCTTSFRKVITRAQKRISTDRPTILQKLSASWVCKLSLRAYFAVGRKLKDCHLNQYLREFRISNLQGSYFKSSLWRYIEEGLAQTIALGRVKGLSASFVGLRFPVQNGYVFLTKAGGYNKAMLGNGVFQEGAGLIASGMMSGITLQLWFKPGIPDRHSGSVGASDAR